MHSPASPESCHHSAPYPSAPATNYHPPGPPYGYVVAYAAVLQRGLRNGRGSTIPQHGRITERTQHLSEHEGAYETTVEVVDEARAKTQTPRARPGSTRSGLVT